MIVKLPFGTDTVPVDLRGLRVRALRPSAPHGSRDVGRLVAEALDRPVAGASLADLASGRRTVTLVVPDATRSVDLPAVLPPVLERLARGGVDPGGVTVLIASGTHPPVPDDRLADLVGPLPGGSRVVQHDARDDASLVRVGTTAGGLDVRIHRLARNADLLLTIGGVRHHYFAGFGGGPKLVFPGIAGYREIQANHARVVRREGCRLAREERCEPGVLDGNPVALEIAEAAELAPPDFAVCLVPGSDERPAFAAAGPWRAAFEAAVRTAKTWYEIRSPGRFPLAVASAGGAPSDATLIQAHKGLDAACRFLEPGGELLFAAELGGGAGSGDMDPFLDDPSPRAILERLEQRWVQYGHTTLRLVEKTARFRVHLVSHFDRSTARRLGFNPVDDAAAVVDGWRKDHPGGEVAVVAGAPVYPALGEST